MPSSDEYEVDGDVIMQNVHHPVFEFIQAPKLVSWNQNTLVNWKKRRDQYEECVRQCCVESGECLEVVMAPVKTSIDPKLLEVTCMYELQEPVGNVSSGQLMTLISQRVRRVKNEQVPDLDAFFVEHLKVYMTEDDIDARILKFFRDFLTLIEENGLTDILGVGDPACPGYDDRMKLRCNMILDNLEPAVVKDDDMRHARYVNRSAKKNDFILFGVIKEKARGQHKYYVLSLKQKARSSSSRSDKVTSDKSAGHTKTSTKRGQHSGTSVGLSGSNDKPPKEDKVKSPPRTGCCHCKGNHWLRDCPTASEADKTAATERMKAIRESERAKKITAALAAGEVLVNGLIAIPYCADSGAITTYVPRQYVRELIDLGGEVKLKPLPHEEIITVAGGSTLSYCDEVRLNLLLQTLAGPVHLHDVSCIVIDDNELELILGNDMLVSLSIDVNAQLSQLESGSTVEDIDPFKSPEPAEVSNRDVRQHLESKVVAAVENGFAPEHLKQLRARRDQHSH